MFLCGAFATVTACGKKGPTIQDGKTSSESDRNGSAVKGWGSGRGEKRIFRLTVPQLEETAQFAFPGVVTAPLKPTMPLDPKQNNYDYSDYLTMNAANFFAYEQWVDGIVAAVPGQIGALIPCSSPSATDSCTQKAVGQMVRRALRGAVAPSVETAYSQRFQEVLQREQNIATAAQDLVKALMFDPFFLFRKEFETDSRGRLLPGEYRQALSYTITDAPEPTFVEGLNQPTKGDPLSKVFRSPKARAKLERFFFDWLEIKSPEEFRISAQDYPEFTPQVAAAAVQEAQSFIRSAISKNKVGIREILTAPASRLAGGAGVLYANDGGTSRNSQVGLQATPVQKRMGIFTQPAFIASRSGPVKAGIIKRGVFFTRKVMCVPTGEVPPGVDISIPDSLGKTEREHVELGTKKPACAGCHAVINPFGFMFENYDAIGRWRTMEKGQPVNPQVSMDFLADPKVVTNSASEALQYLFSTDQFHKCFAKQLFRFYMGRDDAQSDQQIIEAMSEQLQKHDDVFGALQKMVTSASFGTRS